RCVDFAAVADVGDSFNPRDVGDRRYDRVVPEIDHIEESCCEVRGEQLPSFVIDRKVIEAASRGAGKIDRRDLPQCLTGNRCWLGADACRERASDGGDAAYDDTNTRGTLEHL